jgi:hypothetical protein
MVAHRASLEPAGAVTHRVLDFHVGLGPDHAGRRVGDILAFGDEELEYTHDYIQWLFPLAEPSRAVPGSPVITPAEITAFRKSAAARSTQVRALERMLRFYGLEFTPGASPGQVRRAGNFAPRKEIWLTPGNHNLLRLTRIIKSLRLLGNEPHARALFDALRALYAEEPETIGPMTWRFWQEASASGT